MTMIWSCIRTALVSGFVTLAAAVSLSACSSGSISGEVDGGPTSDGGSSGSDAAGGSGAVGFLHTQGNKIVDSRGVQVRLTGVSWFGMETDTFSPHGLDRRSLGSMLDQIKSLGYNSIRIPFSTQMLDAGSQAKGIDFAQNPSLQNKKPIEILDEVIRQAGARRLRIILDRHRPDAYSQANLWYTGAYSERRWIDDWKLLAARYKSDSTVVGFDLHNEPHGEATWGSGNQANDWRLAAERAGNEILAVHPDLLMIVEGIEQVGGKYYWWGGNLMAVGQNLVRLSVADRVVYSVHDYPASVYGQSWFSDAKYPANLPGVWDSYWGYVAKQNIAPVWIGEFGTKYLTDSDKKWMATLVDYISQNQLSFAYWCWNPNSNDTGGILKDDWLTINTDKQAVIAPALAPSL